MGDVLTSNLFTLIGSGNDITFGNIRAGSIVSLGLPGQSGAVHDITGGDIASTLLAFNSIHNGSVEDLGTRVSASHQRHVHDHEQAGRGAGPAPTCSSSTAATSCSRLADKSKVHTAH